MRTLTVVGAMVCVCAGCAVPAAPPVAAQEPLNDPMTCRNIVGEAEIDGTMQQISGLACQQPDGTWQIQQGGDAAALVYPIPAYPYYDPWYWGPPVAVGFGASFVFVDRFHHFHHMNHVHWGRPGGGFHGMGGARGWGGGHTWSGMGGMGGGHRR